MSNLLKDNKELMKEYNYLKNTAIDFNNITLGSNKKIWWVCEKGHEWEAPIYSRVNNGCPICANKIILGGYNDLTTTNSDLAAEWNYEKNANLKSNMVTSGSHKKVWWKCENGHEWDATVYNRNKGTKCPICSKLKRKEEHNIK